MRKVILIVEMLIHKRNWDLAIHDFSKTIEIEPENYKAYFGRGVSYGCKQQFDLAILDLSQSIEINPRESKAYNNRGVFYGITGKTELAKGDFLKALEITPQFPEASKNLELISSNQSMMFNIKL